MYYDYDKISSYNATFNMIITNRGFGKTYGAKKRAINKFIKKGEQFIYVRRYKSELKKVKDKFFEKVKKEFECHKFEINGFTAYIVDKVAGYLILLSKLIRVSLKLFIISLNLEICSMSLSSLFKFSSLVWFLSL